MITNCKVETLDETKKINSIFFSLKHKIYSINSKKNNNLCWNIGIMFVD